MILGIGIDLVSIDRIERVEKKFNEKFLKKIFTENEVICSKEKSNQKIFLAKRFAAKEAFSKAIGLGIGRGVNFIDIETFNDEFGKPKIKILNNKEEFLKRHFCCESFSIHLSISDEKTFASAIVVIEKTQ